MKAIILMIGLLLNLGCQSKEQYTIMEHDGIPELVQGFRKELSISNDLSGIYVLVSFGTFGGDGTRVIRVYDNKCNAEYFHPWDDVYLNPLKMDLEKSQWEILIKKSPGFDMLHDMKVKSFDGNEYYFLYFNKSTDGKVYINNPRKSDGIYHKLVSFFKEKMPCKKLKKIDNSQHP